MDERVMSALELMERALYLLDDAQEYEVATELRRLIDRLKSPEAR